MNGDKFDRFTAPERAEVELKASKLKWSTTPSGGSLDHVLSINIQMTTDQRAQLETLLTHYWELKYVITGTLKPEQAAFETATGDDNDEGKELGD